MAWIKWRRNRAGIRQADLRWYGPDGKERSRSLRTSDPVLAQKAVEAHHRAAEGRRTLDTNPTVSAALGAFYAALEVDRSAGTVAFYRKHLGAVAARMPATFRAWTTQAFRAAVQAAGGRVTALAPRTVQMRINAWRRFLRWAGRSGWIVPDFVVDFRGRSVVTRVPRALSLEDRAALLAACRGQAIELVVGLAALAGMRPSEWRAVTWRSVRWRGTEVVVPGTKRHRERVVPLGAALLDILSRHRPKGAGGPIVDPAMDVRARLGTLGRRLGLDHTLTPYTLRHTFATGLVQTGADVPTIAALMGHSTPTTTYRYLHTDPARLRAAVERGT